MPGMMVTMTHWSHIETGCDRLTLLGTELNASAESTATQIGRNVNQLKRHNNWLNGMKQQPIWTHTLMALLVTSLHLLSKTSNRKMCLTSANCPVKLCMFERASCNSLPKVRTKPSATAAGYWTRVVWSTPPASVGMHCSHSCSDAITVGNAFECKVSVELRSVDRHWKCSVERIRLLIQLTRTFGSDERCTLNISSTEQMEQQRVERLLFRSSTAMIFVFMLANSEIVADRSTCAKKRFRCFIWNEARLDSWTATRRAVEKSRLTKSNCSLFNQNKTVNWDFQHSNCTVGRSGCSLIEDWDRALKKGIVKKRKKTAGEDPSEELWKSTGRTAPEVGS